MVSILVLFIVMYMLSWRAKNRAMTAWALTTGVLFVAAILLGDKGIGMLAGVFLFLPLVGFIPWRKSHEDLAHEDSKSYDEAMGIHRIQSVNPMHDDWSYW